MHHVTVVTRSTNLGPGHMFIGPSQAPGPRLRKSRICKVCTYLVSKTVSTLLKRNVLFSLPKWTPPRPLNAISARTRSTANFWYQLYASMSIFYDWPCAANALQTSLHGMQGRHHPHHLISRSDVSGEIRLDTRSESCQRTGDPRVL